MFHCPQCDGQVIERKFNNLVRQVSEWKCLLCSRQYGLEELKKAILTV